MKTTATKLMAILMACALLVGCTAGAGGTKNTTATTTVTTTVATTAATTTLPTTTTTTQQSVTTTVPPQAASRDLMATVSADTPTGKAVDAAFTKSYTDFALNFLKNAHAEEDDNVLISPLSVQLVMAMLANGAGGTTRQEIETALGGLSVADLNAYLYDYVQGMPQSDLLKIANAIWFRNTANIKQSFLRTNAAYYQAAMYQSVFNSKTVEEINEWVSKNTDGLIDGVIEELSRDDVMLLVNTLLFEADWASAYPQNQTSSATFTTEDGEIRQVPFLRCKENTTYLATEQEVGFAKAYKGGTFSFVALLPAEGISLDAYINGLTTERVQAVLNADRTQVLSDIPKFTVEYEADMEEILKAMGVRSAFDSAKADLTGIGNGLHLEEVIHKTKIELNEAGTKVGAVSSARVMRSAVTTNYPRVELNRPFVYMIVDTTTNTPIFLGTVTDIGK